ncbi:hypothetical protein B0H13DRAFT_2194215, partial [Mycena leptocephala]
MARTRPATIAEPESFARADPDIADPNLDLKYCLRRAEEHSRAGRELAWDAGANMEQAFVEYARARTLIIETIPAHRDYATIMQAEQRVDLAANGQEILVNLDRLRTPLIERYERYVRSGAFADAVPIFMIPSDSNIN